MYSVNSSWQVIEVMARSRGRSHRKTTSETEQQSSEKTHHAVDTRSIDEIIATDNHTHHICFVLQETEFQIHYTTARAHNVERLQEGAEREIPERRVPETVAADDGVAIVQRLDAPHERRRAAQLLHRDARRVATRALQSSNKRVRNRRQSKGDRKSTRLNSSHT